MKGGNLFLRHQDGAIEEFDAHLEEHCLVAKNQKIIHVPILIHGYLTSSNANEINFGLFEQEFIKLCKSEIGIGIYATPLYPDSRLKAVMTHTIEGQAELVCNNIREKVEELASMLEKIAPGISLSLDVIGTSQGAAVALEVWYTIFDKWKRRSRFVSINGGVSNGCAIIDALYLCAQRHLPIGAKALSAQSCRARFLPKRDLLNQGNCFLVGSRSKNIKHVIDAFIPRRVPELLRVVVARFIASRLRDSDGVFSVQNQIPPELKDRVTYVLFENVNHFDPISDLSKDLKKASELNRKFVELYRDWCKEEYNL